MKQQIPMSDARMERVNAQTEQNTRTIAYATNSINDLAGELNPTIPESIFKKYFLPMFAGESPENYPPTAPEEWMRISVKGMSRVNVIDETGKTVAVVPARYARSLVNIRTERNSVSLVDSMQTFSDLASSSPPRAMAYFHNVIMPTTKNKAEFDTVMQKYVDDLTVLLKYFGKNTAFLNNTVNGNKEEVNDAAKPQPVDDSDYRDDELL